MNDGMSTDRAWQRELRGLLQLALPVVAVQLGMRAMATVDILMIGRVSEEAMAAVSVGNAWVWFVFIFGIGMLMAADPLFSQAVGARDDAAISRTMQRGLVLAIGLTAPAMLAIWPVDTVLGWTEQPDHIVGDATSYARIVSLGALPMFVAHLARVALQAYSKLRPMLIAIVLTNLFNVFANWVLIFGKLGFPALGVEGSAWATTASRWLLAILILGSGWGLLGRHVLSFRVRELRERALRVAPILRMAWIGVPIAVQISLELGVFAATTLTVGSLGAAVVSGHQVALDLASITFMVPMGLGFAGSVRVGNAIGRGDMPGARRAAVVVLGVASVFAVLFTGIFLAIPTALASLYTFEAEVVTVAAVLLPIAGVFQLFDGIQAVAIGVLRGIGVTRVPMLINVIGFWLIGFPIALWLCFESGLGAAGMWWGLVVGLGAVAVLLLYVTRARFRQDHGRLSID